MCLVHMGKNGLEMVKSFPEILPEEAIKEITIKSMPLGAKEGDFSSNVLTNDNAFSGYVFTIPSQIGRDNIASLVAVFEDMSYNTTNVRKAFTVLIYELKKQNALSTEILTNILPSLYKGFDSKNIKIKISSVVTVEINFDDKNDDTDQGSPEAVAKSVMDEMWR